MRMKSGTAWLALFCAIAMVVVVSGCGGGSSSEHTATTSTSVAETKDASDNAAASESTPKAESEPTKAQQETAPIGNLKVSVPGGLTTANTCKGKNTPPEISWSKVPPGTEEVAVFAVNVKPVKGKLYFDGALAGIDPSVTRLKPGLAPAGAIQGKTSSGAEGWSLCPRDAKPETYIFSVYALSKSLSPKEGFDPLKFRVQATPIAKVGLEGEIGRAHV